MKKAFFLITLLSLNLGFSKEVNEKKTIEKMGNQFSVTCCSQSASAGTPGTNSWVNVTVTTCQQGPPALVQHAACAHAGAAAKRQLASIQQNITHEVTID